MDPQHRPVAIVSNGAFFFVPPVEAPEPLPLVSDLPTVVHAGPAPSYSVGWVQGVLAGQLALAAAAVLALAVVVYQGAETKEAEYPVAQNVAHSRMPTGSITAALRPTLVEP